MNTKLVSRLTGLLLLAPTLLCAAQDRSAIKDFDLGSAVTSHQRFLLYPHLQKGWDSMHRGDRDGAFRELEHAHRLAPDNAAVALLLVEAYHKFGETARAESVLRDQLKRFPHDARLAAALGNLQVSHSPAAVPAVPAVGACVGSAPCLPATTVKSQPADGVSSLPAAAGVGPLPVAQVRRRAARATPALPEPAANRDETAPPVSMDPRAGFTAALATRRFDDAQHEAAKMLAQGSRRPELLDELSYRLVEAGASEQAARFLMEAYPFAAGSPAERDGLLQRLALLIKERRDILSSEELLPLRAPLDTPALRSRQAALWENLEECSAIRVVLGDMSPEYGYDDWLRLGDCSTAAAAAEQVYARAHALRPGGRASRELGYRAYAAGHYEIALEAWRSVGAEGLSRDELLAAATTALAGGAHEQAVKWLNSYRDRGDAPVHQYWSLLAESSMNSDPAAAAAALERAIELDPEADDFVRLARLQKEPERQVRWLRRAAELDPDNATVALELGYAYSRGGWHASALAALQRAAALDPDNVNGQIELGYAYWRNGYTAEAERALERAWRADPGNLTVTEQLVYVHQRLSQNKQARAYAERVLDAPSASGGTAAASDSASSLDRRFGFQRLHEDLDRRLTVSIDGFSGSHLGTGPSGSQAGRGYRSYTQLEADVRLGGPPVRNGATLSAYARVLADGGEMLSALPSENAVLGVGLRWKPWGSQVIYFAAEHQTALDDRSRRDVLLRASASFFNGARHGDDWHASGRGWVSRNLYLDAARYLDASYSAFTTDYRTSYHRKVSANQTVEPYGHLQVSGIKSVNVDSDIRSGVGLRWNLWAGASHYDAPSHKISVGLEFQQAFKTYLTDRNGLFFTLGTRW